LGKVGKTMAPFGWLLLDGSFWMVPVGSQGPTIHGLSKSLDLQNKAVLNSRIFHFCKFGLMTIPLSNSCD
jgi:hypothetical protein